MLDNLKTSAIVSYYYIHKQTGCGLLYQHWLAPY